MRITQGDASSQRNEKSRAFLSGARRFCLVFGSGLAALLLMLNLPVTRGLVLKQMTERIGSDTEINVRHTGFWWIPFLGMHVTGLEIDAAGRHILSCPDAVLNFGLSVASGGLVIQQIRLNRPILQLQKVNGKLTPFKTVTGKRDSGNAKAIASPPSGAARQPDHDGITVQVCSGEITAEQNGLRVLEIKNVSGALVLKHDGELTAPFLNLDALRRSK